MKMEWEKPQLCIMSTEETFADLGGTSFDGTIVTQEGQPNRGGLS